MERSGPQKHRKELHQGQTLKQPESKAQSGQRLTDALLWAASEPRCLASGLTSGSHAADGTSAFSNNDQMSATTSQHITVLSLEVRAPQTSPERDPLSRSCPSGRDSSQGQDPECDAEVLCTLGHGGLACEPTL